MNSYGFTDDQILLIQALQNPSSPLFQDQPLSHTKLLHESEIRILVHQPLMRPVSDVDCKGSASSDERNQLSTYGFKNQFI